jgi:prepilin-type N-terminal cleavage/methylation domain-containing protein
MRTCDAPAIGPARAGFSLLETLLVVSVLALLLGLSVPTWDGYIRDRRVTRAAEDVAGLLRYAQQAAVADSADACGYRAVVLATAAQAVKVARDPNTGACASPEVLTTVRVTDAFAIGTTAAPSTVEFASTGASSTCGGAATEIVVSSGSRTRTVRVEPCTGAVEVLP